MYWNFQRIRKMMVELMLEFCQNVEKILLSYEISLHQFYHPKVQIGIFPLNLIPLFFLRNSLVPKRHYYCRRSPHESSKNWRCKLQHAVQPTAHPPISFLSFYFPNPNLK